MLWQRGICKREYSPIEHVSIFICMNSARVCINSRDEFVITYQVVKKCLVYINDLFPLGVILQLFNNMIRILVIKGVVA